MRLYPRIPFALAMGVCQCDGVDKKHYLAQKKRKS